GGALEWGAVLGGSAARRLGGNRGRRFSRGRAAVAGGRPLAHDAALEQGAPIIPDGLRVLQELFVHGLREARVGRFEHIGFHACSRMPGVQGKNNVTCRGLPAGASLSIPFTVANSMPSPAQVRTALLAGCLFAAACRNEAGPVALGVAYQP